MGIKPFAGAVLIVRFCFGISMSRALGSYHFHSTPVSLRKSLSYAVCRPPVVVSIIQPNHKLLTPGHLEHQVASLHLAM